jgi:hypothetical protein
MITVPTVLQSVAIAAVFGLAALSSGRVASGDSRSRDASRKGVYRMTDGPYHLQPIDIDPERVRLWLMAAKELGEAGKPLATELADLGQDPTMHRLARCAKAARYAERVTTGHEQLIANAVAVELEDLAGR